ncbi:hypothetical protein EDC01DRAFT_425080 [Geopyxis carbonaria]|nr:hypothetical protein EDC01DRAFT_425080 [Geopyxis carbonaria]
MVGVVRHAPRRLLCSCPYIHLSCRLAAPASLCWQYYELSCSPFAERSLLPIIRSCRFVLEKARGMFLLRVPGSSRTCAAGCRKLSRASPVAADVGPTCWPADTIDALPALVSWCLVLSVFVFPARRSRAVRDDSSGAAQSAASRRASARRR